MRVLYMQRTRTTLLVVVIALISSMLTLFVRSPDADACSMAPPMLEVWPADSLSPGETISVNGYGFSDVIFHPWEEEYDAEGNLIPPHSCAGIELVPMEVTVSWVGERTERIGKAMGPDFSIRVVVPDWAQPGAAIIEANGFEAYVQVGGEEPCPVHLLDGSDQGFAPPPLPPECPDPCLLDQPAVDVWCPDPCLLDQPAVEPWCPDPCHDVLRVTGDIVYPPCPEPCPIPSGVLVFPPCPDPCEWMLDEQIRPACPEPCPAHVLGFEGDHPPVWPDCPWPCPPTILMEPDRGEPDWIEPWPGDCPLPCPLPAVAVTDDVPPNRAEMDPAILGCPEPCWEPGVFGCPMPGPEPIPLPEPLPEPIPHPEPLPEPLPEPIPMPMPFPCLLQPDGTVICPAVLTWSDHAEVNSTPEPAALTRGNPTATVSATDAAMAVDRVVATVPAPPRPFIDFDGCRLDGADDCM